MTRFDEALREFAAAAEPAMSARVATEGTRQATISQIGRQRTRRAALQVTATVAAVGLVAAGSVVAAGLFGTVNPVARPGGDLTPLSDPAFTCGAPFPYEPGQTEGVGAPTLPTVEQQAIAHGDSGYAAIDLAPGATTLPTEEGVIVAAAIISAGEGPGDWGATNFGALVDPAGRVVAVSETEPFALDDGPVAGSTFAQGSCALLLNGVYTVHIVTQYWVDDPANIVGMWVDEGIPGGASLTFDASRYEEQVSDDAQRVDEATQKAKAAIVVGGGTLETVDGPAAIPRTTACTLSGTIAAGGVASLPALAIDLPRPRATLDGREVTWTYDYGQLIPWWAEGGDFAVIFLDQDGNFVSGGLARPTTTIQGPTGIISRAVLEPYELCGLTGVPTASGTYGAFVFSPYLGPNSEFAPDALKDLEGLAYVSGWASLGTYTVP